MNNEYLWDLLLPELVPLFAHWLDPLSTTNQRQRVATNFAMRALRRCMATDALFKQGYYLEASTLVRTGYEDWVYLAFVLHKPGDDRAASFGQQIHKHDARVYDAFSALAGAGAADQYFGEPPLAVAQYVGLPRGQTQAPALAAMADDVDLRKVHDCAYTYLSGVAHPDARVNHIFDDVSDVYVAQIPSRNPTGEFQLALWLGWFTARVAVLACREFGLDQEWFCDEYFMPIAADTPKCLETAVLVREAPAES